MWLCGLSTIQKLCHWMPAEMHIKRWGFGSALKILFCLLDCSETHVCVFQLRSIFLTVCFDVEFIYLFIALVSSLSLLVVFLRWPVSQTPKKHVRFCFNRKVLNWKWGWGYCHWWCLAWLEQKLKNAKACSSNIISK